MKALALAAALLTFTALQSVCAADGQPRSVQASAPLAKPAKHAPEIGAVATRGEPHGLRLEGDTLVYCDKRGERAIDLRTSREAARAAACPAPEEPNAACSGLGIDVDVRAPLSAPNEVIDVNGRSVPVRGRVRDCVVEGGLMAVATGSSITLIEVATATASTVDRAGGERVILGPSWVAWSTGARLRWMSRPPR
jgi:hypothetical protein